MFEKNGEHPHCELPEAFVEEMLDQCDKLGSDLSGSFQRFYGCKTEMHSKLSGKKYWPNPHRLSEIHTTAHSDRAVLVAKAIMM